MAQEQQRLEATNAQIAQTEQALGTAQAAVEEKQKELQSLQKQTKRTAYCRPDLVQETRSMGKRRSTGNITRPYRVQHTWRSYAWSTGFLLKAENSRLEEKTAKRKKSTPLSL